MSEHSVKTHPSYAIVSWSRVRCGQGMDCYMSDIAHDTFVEVTISSAETHRSLHRDRTFPRDSLCTIRMSELQFARFITTPNAEGVPCTLTRKDGKFIESCPASNTIEQYRGEVDDTMGEMISQATDTIAQVQEMLKSKSVKKADLREVASRLERTVRDMRGSLPFLTERFKEHMDSVYTDAVTSFEAHMTERMTARTALSEDPYDPERINTPQLPK